MQNQAIKPRSTITIPSLRDTKLFLLASSRAMAEELRQPSTDDEFIFTKNHQ